MNKIFTKVATLSVGLMMAIGVGVALGAKSVSKASASATAITASEVEDGDYCFIVANGYVLKAGAAFAAKGSGARTEAFDGEALSQNDAWLFSYDTDHWTISTEVESTTYYLYVTNDNNGLVCGSTVGEWSISAVAEETTSYLTSSDGTNTRYLANYNNSNFRCYKSTTSGYPKIQLYRYVAPSKIVSSIEATKLPTKTTYAEGEVLDLTGVEITAHWSDSSTSDCTDSAIFSPADGSVLSSSNTSVTVSFGGKTTSFAITVNAKTFATTDLALTAEKLGMTKAYGSTDVSVTIGEDDFIFGRTDVMMSYETYGSAIQLKANSGKFYNKSKFSAPISKVYFLADADNDFAPSNWSVYASSTTAGEVSNALEIATVDPTNRIYSVDFTGSDYYYFTVAKTGGYATYFDMIVIELSHSADDVAAVRNAATAMLSDFAAFCSAEKGPSDSQWEGIAAHYTTLTTAQKSIFDATLLNTAACNKNDEYGAPVQATNIQKAVQKIEYCVTAYGVDNFTSRDIPVSAYYPTFEQAGNNSSFMIIVITSVLAVTALSVLIVIRKKQHNK